MTIVYFDPPHSPPSCGWTLKGGRTYSISVDVETDDPRIGPRTIRLDFWSRILRGQTYYRWPLSGNNGPPVEVDYGCILSSLTVETRTRLGKVPHGGYWRINMEFSPDEPRESGVDPADPDAKENPFLVPVKVTWDSEDVKRSWPYDATTPTPKYYVNAAGEPLQDPPEVDDSYPVFSLVRNEKTYDFTVPQAYKNRCNQGPWLFWDDNICRCRSISPERQYLPDWGVYWTVTYTFQIKPEGWKVRILNAGTRQKVGGVLQQILVQGVPTADPVPLNSDGTYTYGATPNYLEFQQYPQIDFSAFNFSVDDFASGYVW